MKLKEDVEKTFTSDPLYDIFHGVSLNKYLEGEDLEDVQIALGIIEEAIETIFEGEEY